VDPIIPKHDLKTGHYYEGICRNAHVARWDGSKFWYWRNKFGGRFVEWIMHPDDDGVFDVFHPEKEIQNPDEVIPME
jgi:hypothetical protein